MTRNLIEEKDKGGSRIRVNVRCREQLASESSQPSTLTIINQKEIDFVNVRCQNETQRFSFDGCYGPKTSQKELFNKEVKELITHVFAGNNISVLAYGATGAGKTYTMQGTKKDLGIIPRTLKRLFKFVGAHQAKKLCSYSVTLSSLEIYNEEVFDMIDVKGKSLPVRQDSNGVVHVLGLHELPINSFSEFEAAFDTARTNRTTGFTLLNSASSRSHFFIIVKVERQLLAQNRTYHGKIVLVDLAGSEDNRRTGNQGKAILESGMINKSLLAFNTLVEQLSSGKGFPNYRQSCLTRLLKDSLGGNSLSCLIANVAQGNYQDTLNTLNFAKKGMKIVNTPLQTININKPLIPVHDIKCEPHVISLDPNKPRRVLVEKENICPGAERKRSPSIAEFTSGKVNSLFNTLADQLKAPSQLTDSYKALVMRSFVKEAEHAANEEDAIASYQRALVYCCSSEQAAAIAGKIFELKKNSCPDKKRMDMSHKCYEKKNKKLEEEESAGDWAPPIIPLATFPIYKDGGNSDVQKDKEKSDRVRVQVNGIRMKLEEKLLAFVNASASEQELQKLKGIGKVHSKKIMEFKEKNGSFYSVGLLCVCSAALPALRHCYPYSLRTCRGSSGFPKKR
ncbi:kinesin-like protein KIF22 isoform X2 [Zophobas morio]|uniref:kinesin-like protein KIF22 isoform X2 n=1 Tax=Zophobas morio TaxID=2755281 RepID=UPI003083C867